MNAPHREHVKNKYKRGEALLKAYSPAIVRQITYSSAQTSNQFILELPLDKGNSTVSAITP